MAKSNGLRLAKQQLCTCITRFCSFLSRRCTTTKLLRRGREHKTTTLAFNSKNIASIWRIKRDVISVIKFEAAQIHILSDVFVAFAVVVQARWMRSDDGDGNEYVKKAVVLITKTTTLRLHHAFLYMSWPSLHDYDVKMSDFTFYRGSTQETTKFPLSF